MKVPLVLALAVFVTFAGCIQNINDLKGKAEAADEPVETAAVETATPPPATEPIAQSNTTQKITKPPVARMTVFGANNALVFKSTFKADDPAEIVFVEEGVDLTLIAADSEAVEPAATITGYAWKMHGSPMEGTRQASIKSITGGLHAITLTVTDSHGKTDEQTVKIGVVPKDIEVVTELVTGPLAGAGGVGTPADVVFDLSAAAAGVPANITSVRIEAMSPATCDAMLTVVGPDGSTLADGTDGAGPGEPETYSGGALPEGAYAISVGAFACAAPEGVPVIVTVVYKPVVEGLGAGDGHGHAH